MPGVKSREKEVDYERTTFSFFLQGTIERILISSFIDRRREGVGVLLYKVRKLLLQQNEYFGFGSKKALEALLRDQEVDTKAVNQRKLFYNIPLMLYWEKQF